MIVDMKVDKKQLKDFVRFFLLRQDALLHKSMGWEFEDDDIIRDYKFCNIDREYDAVTVWIRENIRERKPLQSDFCKMVTELTAARIFNHPPTLERILPLKTIRGMKDALYDVRETEGKIMRGAYMMPAHSGGDAIEYWSRAIESVRFMFGSNEIPESFARAAKIIEVSKGIGGFVANQIITDLRYTPFMKHVPDFDTYVAPGPGTRRGIRRVCGLDINERTVDSDIVKTLLLIRQLPSITEVSYGVFDDPNNLSNAFCEYDKYCRAREQKQQGKRITLKRYGTKS